MNQNSSFLYAADVPGRTGPTRGCNHTMTDGIACLPPEIVLQILSYLCFNDLLTFGTTCRSNYEYHIVSLKRLRLGVFEKRIHSVISLLQAGWANPDQVADTWRDNQRGSNYTISVVHQKSKAAKQEALYKYPYQTIDVGRRTPTPHDKPQSLERMVRMQNRIFARVLRRYGPSLQSLEFMAYDINPEGAAALGTGCQHTLRHLALRFEHPHIRDGLMRPSSWLHPAPGNEAWNLIIGIGRFEGTGLRNLETLILERAGITPWQLMMLVKKNPNLTTLKLRTCRGAQPEFLNWLGGIKNDFDEPETQFDGPAPGAKLEVLSLEHCHRLFLHPIEEHDDLPDDICDSGFEWVRGLGKLQSLSFRESANIPPELIDRANKTIWKIPQVILPYYLYDGDSIITVEPQWK